MSDWSSDVCATDLRPVLFDARQIANSKQQDRCCDVFADAPPPPGGIESDHAIITGDPSRGVRHSTIELNGQPWRAPSRRGLLAEGQRQCYLRWPRRTSDTNRTAGTILSTVSKTRELPYLRLATLSLGITAAVSLA